MKPDAGAVARAALSLISGSPIPYVLGGETPAGLDCQGLVELCVRQSGGKMAYAGSNDMFRNACAWRGTLEEAKRTGRLVPGAALFIVAKDGREPDKYKADSLGNASHVGLYAGAPGAEVVHASSSRGCVAASALSNGWTHAAWLAAASYAQAKQEAKGADAMRPMTVTAPSGSTVNLRQRPDGALLSRVPVGAAVEAGESDGGWTRVTYQGLEGYMMDLFLAAVREEGNGLVEVDAQEVRRVLAYLKQAEEAMEGWLQGGEG